MSADREQELLARLQAILTALLKHELSNSLGEVEGSLQKWRAGELGPFEAHAALLRHTSRAERLAARIAQAGPGSSSSVLRDAFDAGLVNREDFIEIVGKPPEQVDPSPVLADTDEPTLPDKQAFVSDLLEEGAVLLHIDARREEASVPPSFVGDPKLVLRFGYGLTPEIFDLTVDDSGISGTLTFGGVPHHCVLPWPAIYAAVSEISQQAMVWPDDVPAVVLDQMSNPAEKDEPPPEPPKPKRRASHLKLVD